MKKNLTDKTAERFVDSVKHSDFDSYSFSMQLMEQPYDVQERIVETFVIFLKMYKYRAGFPALAYQISPKAKATAETVDLTEFDQ